MYLSEIQSWFCYEYIINLCQNSDCLSFSFYLKVWWSECTHAVHVYDTMGDLTYMYMYLHDVHVWINAVLLITWMQINVHEQGSKTLYCIGYSYIHSNITLLTREYVGTRYSEHHILCKVIMSMYSVLKYPLTFVCTNLWGSCTVCILGT